MCSPAGFQIGYAPQFESCVAGALPWKDQSAGPKSSVDAEHPLIAIVDDDDLVLRSLARLLRASGFRVLTFSSAEEFLLPRHPEDIACMVFDLRLPGISGTDLQALLVTRKCPTPIVFVTAHDETETRAQALRNGAVAFLGKPLNGDALLQAIQTALEGNR